MNLVTANTYLEKHEAQIAQSFLASEGIESQIFADDEGALNPALSFASPVKLMVWEKDLDNALQLLASIDVD